MHSSPQTGASSDAPILLLSNGPLGSALREAVEGVARTAYIDLLSPADVVFENGQTWVVQLGEAICVENYSCLFYQPGSYDLFLQSPFASRVKTNLERRSCGEFALFFESRIESHPSYSNGKALGNSPSAGRHAANRFSLCDVLNKDPCAWRIGGTLRRLPSHLKYSGIYGKKSPVVLKFAIDTHLPTRGGAYRPFLADSLDEVVSLAPELPCTVELFLTGQFDYRVIVVDDEIMCFRWARLPETLDAREANELNAELIYDEHLSLAARSITARFGLRYATLDFVDFHNNGDVDNRNLVDLNPHGSWDWVSIDARRQVRESIQLAVRSRLRTEKLSSASDNGLYNSGSN